MLHRPLRVLLVDDDEQDRWLVRRRLSQGAPAVEVLEAATLADGTRTACQQQLDVVILDMTLPESSGLSTVKQFKESAPHLPIVVLTGLTDDSLAQKVIEVGAQDFVNKSDLDNPWLLRCLRNAIQHHELQERLRQKSYRDSLTGLPNRAMFEGTLRTEFQRASSDKDFAVVFIDLDDFKLINDCYGHCEGDHVLSEFGARLKHCVSCDDVVARFGGDEFVVLLRNVTSDDEVQAFAERLRKALDCPVSVDGKQVFLAASVGYVNHGNSYGNPQDLLRDADTAMYQAKKVGKGRHRKFSQAMRDNTVEEVGMASRLRQALHNGELTVVYQPIVSLTTREVLKFEALLRWTHPEYGIVSPLKFIPLAERVGLIVPFGQWVLEQACRQLHEWDAHFPNCRLQICVNVSPIQVLEPTFVERVINTTETAGIDAGRLEIEITESTIMENSSTTVSLLQTLRQSGIRISIDDFGTGYSSLAQLHRFQFDSLKIDRSFIRELLTEGYADLLVQTVLLLANSVGLDVIAEGIETQEEANRLVTLGCGVGQGYLFGKPLDSQSASSLLESHHAVLST